MMATIRAQPATLLTPPELKNHERGEWIGGLLEDLETLRFQLEAASQCDAKFHMAACY